MAPGLTMAGRRVLVVFAHPLQDSLAASLRDAVVGGLEAAGHEPDIVDLYADGFRPELTADERAVFKEPGYAPPAEVAGYCDRLKRAHGVVFVFPQWWFGMPAILKGFVDRVFAPDVAYRYEPDSPRITPLLDNLKTFHVVTTTGSPWWVAELIMRNPVRRQISLGIRKFCARDSSFRMLSMYALDTASREKCAAFVTRVRTEFSRL